MAVVLFSLVGFAALTVSFSLFLKVFLKKQTLLMVPLGLCAVVSLDCLIGQLGAFFGITVGVEVISLLNILFAVVLFVAKRKRLSGAEGKKESSKAEENGKVSELQCDKQVHFSNLWTGISYLIIIVFVIACGVIQFGTELNPNYASTDAAAHFWSSMEIAFGQSVPSGMFLTHYETALWIQALASVIDYYELCKVFIVVDLAFLFIIGLLFFAGTQLITKPVAKPLALIITLLCIAGYPLNNTVFGFSYLGAGVMYCFAFALAMFLLRTTPYKKISAILLVFFFYSTLICYNLFVLVEVIFVAAVCFAYLKKRGINNTKLFILVGVFVLLCVVGAEILLSSGFADGLATDGYIYKDLFWSFVLIFPLAVYGFVQANKSNETEYSLFALAIVVCTIGAFILYLRGDFSAYYYYKFYYLLWVALFFLGAIGLSDLIKKKNVFAITYSILAIALFCVTMTGFDVKVSQRYASLSPTAETSSLFGVYTFNLGQMRSEPIPSEEIELFKEGEECSQSGEYIPMIGTNIDVYWHEAMTQVRNDERRYYYYWLYDNDNPQQELVGRLSNSQHLIVLNNREMSPEMAEFLSDKTIVYGNSVGRLYALNESKGY